MELILLIPLIIFFILIIIRYSKRNNKSNLKSISKWMNMSKEERKLIDIKSRDNTLKRKKSLIDNIRKEYRKVSKSSQ